MSCQWSFDRDLKPESEGDQFAHQHAEAEGENEFGFPLVPLMGESFEDPETDGGGNEEAKDDSDDEEPAEMVDLQEFGKEFLTVFVLGKEVDGRSKDEGAGNECDKEDAGLALQEVAPFEVGGVTGPRGGQQKIGGGGEGGRCVDADDDPFAHLHGEKWRQTD